MSACAFFEPAAIENPDPPTTILDDTPCLQLAGDQRHRRSPHAEHLRKELLR
jgi:hypothetical protein